MSNVIFKADQGRFNTKSDYGLKQIKELCTLIGADFIDEKDYCYGFGDANFQGYKLSLTANRYYPRIDLYIDGIWSSRVQVKTLTQVQVNNLIKKLSKFIEEDKLANAKREIKSKISEELHAFGISVRSDRYFNVNNRQFILEKSGEIYSCDRFSRDVYASIETDINELLADIKKDYEEFRSKVRTALNVANEHIELIQEYYK